MCRFLVRVIRLQLNYLQTFRRCHICTHMMCMSCMSMHCVHKLAVLYVCMWMVHGCGLLSGFGVHRTFRLYGLYSGQIMFGNVLLCIKLYIVYLLVYIHTCVCIHLWRVSMHGVHNDCCYILPIVSFRLLCRFIFVHRCFIHFLIMCQYCITFTVDFGLGFVSCLSFIPCFLLLHLLNSCGITMLFLNFEFLEAWNNNNTIHRHLYCSILQNEQ